MKTENGWNGSVSEFEWKTMHLNRSGSHKERLHKPKGKTKS
jgi:hypothetical protein